MTQCNTLNVKLSDSQIWYSRNMELNGTQVPLNLSSNVVDDSNDDNNSPYNLILTNTPVPKIDATLASDNPLRFRKILLKTTI